MISIEIQPIGLEDLKVLEHLSRQTFYESFATNNSEENMQAYLNKAFNSDKLEQELLNPASFFYFALLEGDIVGYMKLNIGSAQTEALDKSAIEIERIYVLSQHQGKKIGQVLFEKALQLAKEKKASYIWLGVWEKNLNAIEFYKKNGFVEFDKHIFNLGDDPQIDIMMKLLLPSH
jgi:ribosomal protein S18 acetylase RimI-like enzyme